jgi:hypothetical protein
LPERYSYGWGTCIIEKNLGADLLEGLPKSEKTAWGVIPLEGWANESFQVMGRTSVRHCVRLGNKCIY